MPPIKNLERQLQESVFIVAVKADQSSLTIQVSPRLLQSRLPQAFKMDPTTELTTDPKIQRLISILCRYPHFELADHEEDTTTISVFEQRCIEPCHRSTLMTVAWEERALRKKGRYTVMTNNVHHPTVLENDSRRPSTPSNSSSLHANLYRYTLL